MRYDTSQKQCKTRTQRQWEDSRKSNAVYRMTLFSMILNDSIYNQPKSPQFVRFAYLQLFKPDTSNSLHARHALTFGSQTTPKRGVIGITWPIFKL